MNVLVACEFSGIVRDAFKEQGHDAVSCDLLPTEKPGSHIIGDVREHINGNWHLMIAHPPCTYLTVSGNKWMKPEFADRFPNRQQKRDDAIQFFMELIEAPIPSIAVENPIGIISSIYRKPNQIIQPWQFGHPETKATCLWLKCLPTLIPTNTVSLPKERSKAMRLHYLPKTPDRWKERSRTFTGIANAMAEQWTETAIKKASRGADAPLSFTSPDGSVKSESAGANGVSENVPLEGIIKRRSDSTPYQGTSKTAQAGTPANPAPEKPCLMCDFCGKPLSWIYRRVPRSGKIQCHMCQNKARSKPEKPLCPKCGEDVNRPVKAILLDNNELSFACYMAEKCDVCGRLPVTKPDKPRFTGEQTEYLLERYHTDKPENPKTKVKR